MLFFTLRKIVVALLFITIFPFCIHSQTESQQLFLSDPSQSMDLVDPVTTGDDSTSQSGLLYIDATPIDLVSHYYNKTIDDTFSITVPNVAIGAEPNRYMLVGLSVNGTQPDQIIPSKMTVTYGGQTVFPIDQTPDGNATVLLFGLVNPPTGIADIIVNFSEESKKGVVVGVTNFSGVNQTTPIGPIVKAQDISGTNLSLTISSSPDELVYDIVSMRNRALTAVSTRQTILHNEDSGSEIVGASSIKQGATSVTMDWSIASEENNAMAVVTIKPAFPNRTSFIQTPALCNTLTIKAGEPISVLNYISIESGSMPLNPLITAELSYGGTSIITLSNPIYDNTTGLLSWTGMLGSDVAVPAGESIALTIDTTEPNVSFFIDYDSETKPSKIEFSRAPGTGIFPPNQPSAITGNTSPSLGATETYSVESEPGVNYNWTLPTGWVQTEGGNTNSIVVTVGSLSGTISVTPNNGFCNGETKYLELYRATKQLYLSDPSFALDRIDPVASSDVTTATSPILTVGTTESVDLIASKDTGIKLKNDSENYGSCSSITIDRETTDSQRMLVQFDLSSIPAGAVVESAELKLNCTSGADMDLSVFKIGDTDAWDEGNLCGANGASNWLQRNATSNWSTDGAIGPDSNSGTPLSTININSTGIQIWDVSCLVEDWVSGVSVNNGLALSVYNENGEMGNRTAEYDTRESANPPILTVTYSLNAVSFRQTPEFCSDFTIKENTPITVETYINVVNGSMPSNPDITAILKSSCSNIIITLTAPIYDATTNLISWSGSLDADNTIPAGDAITLVIGSNESGLEFEIDYDSLTKPSKVAFDTSTFIEILSFDIYDAPYPGGSIITTSEAGNAAYLRTEVTDPFGAYDITDLEVDVFGTTLTSIEVNTTSCAKIYEKEIFLSETGSFSFRATAKEGLEDAVTDKETAYLDITSTKIDFDGNDDHIDFGDVHDLTGPFSTEAWVLQETSVASGTILSKGDNKLGDNRGYVLSVENNIPTLKWYDGTGTTILNLVSPYAITNNKWYHIASTFDGAVVKLYIDGIEIAQETIGALPSSGAEKFIVGAQFDSDSPNSPKKYFNGFMDEVRIWDTALTEQQIREMMNQEIESNGTFVRGKVVPLNISGGLSWLNLIGYYTLTDDIADDKSNNNFFGINKNTSTSQAQTAPLPFTTRIDGQTWDTENTWTNFSVNNLPNSVGIDGVTPIDWNIVKLSHNVLSGDKDITVQALIIDTADKELTIAEPSEINDYNNSGQSLTITKYLELDGIIDLVGESQLIQSSGSILDADSTGYLERDQQGTANSYNYNYWSSSVGPIGSSGPRGTASSNNSTTAQSVLLDGTMPDNGIYPKAINFQTSSAAADSGITNPITISSYWLFKYNGSSDNYYAWQTINEASPISPGEGYTMKGSSGTESILTNQNYVFRGKPYNGDISINLVSGNDRLIGNPYPSAIDAEKFIKDNIGVADGGNNVSGNIFNGALYFWDHFGEENSHNLESYVGGYATRNLIAGAPAIANDDRINSTGEIGTKIPGRYIPVNQGFFVITSLDTDLTGLTTVNGGDILFKNSQRTYMSESPINSAFMRNFNAPVIEEVENNIRPIIRLRFDSPGGLHRQIVAGVDENATDSFDLGYDAPITDKGTEDFYWLIENSNFVIQGVDNFDPDQELPLGLELSENGNIHISIDALENISEDVNIYLHDNVTGLYHDLRTSRFQYYLEADEYLNRFKITFSNDESLSVEEIDLDGLNTYYNIDNNKIFIVNPGEIELTKLAVFDINGRLVYNTKPKQASYSEYLLEHISQGVYIIQIESENGLFTKKIII